MQRTRHAFIVLSVAAMLGGCDSEMVAGNQTRNGTGQEVSTAEPDSSGTELPPRAPEVPAPDSSMSEDPCANTSGPGSYKVFTCEDSSNFVTVDGVSCQEARRRCSLKAAANPETSFYCSWNDRVIHRQEVTAGVCNAQACQGATGLGSYRGYICGSHNFIMTDNIPCQYAVDNCALNASLNPTRSFYCTWNGVEVFRKELVAGICNGIP